MMAIEKGAVRIVALLVALLMLAAGLVIASWACGLVCKLAARAFAAGWGLLP